MLFASSIHFIASHACRIQAALHLLYQSVISRQKLTHRITIEQQYSVRVAIILDTHVERVDTVVVRRLHTTHAVNRAG